MITHPRPKLKLIEFHYDHTITYDSVADWCKHGHRGYSKDNHELRCSHCGQHHFHRNKFTDCIYYTTNWELDEDGDIKTIRTPHTRSHEFIYNIVVRDEFGYTYSSDELSELFHNSRIKTPYGRYRFYNHNSDMENRRVLPENRSDCWWNPKYKHYTTEIIQYVGYRHIRTTQEKRMHDACTIDEDSPEIRGRRRRNALPTVYDDIYVNLQRTWKTRKYRKQWMLNLDK